MKYQHQDLSAGGWEKLSLMEQLANVGSEVERAMKWREKANAEYSQLALMRALELVDLTMKDGKNQKRLKEVVRLREVLGDYFLGENKYGSSDDLWREYFMAFNWAARVKLAEER